jgi:hypothetical protein
MSTAEVDPVRRESREDTLRIVEYTRFPRVAVDQGPQVGFTRDLSASGMCLGVDDAEPIGSLLRVMVCGLDGFPSTARVERVVWCSAERDGRYWLGLELISDARAARI